MNVIDAVIKKRLNTFILFIFTNHILRQILKIFYNLSLNLFNYNIAHSAHTFSHIMY